MALTDQELLLLDNLMYMKESVPPAKEFDTLGEYANYYLNEHPELIVQTEKEKEVVDYKYILEEISGNPKLCALGMGEATPEATDNQVRGRCFTEYDEAGNEVGHIVAFRGTGGTHEAWKDNVEGLYMAETECQGIALDFVESLPYDDITITGHSKGGNMAMYVTAMLGDKIDRCVSFDGQGFGEAFYEMISEEALKIASEKTTSISTHNDYVNILLTPFAGTNICVPNEFTGLRGRHSSTAMYKANETALKQNEGYFTEAMAVDRDWSMEAADTVLEGFIRLCPEDERDLLADLAGTFLAQGMGKNANWGTLLTNLGGDIANYGEKKLDKVGDFLGMLKDGAVYAGKAGFGMVTGAVGNLGELLTDGKDDLVEMGKNAGSNLVETGSEFKDNFCGLFDGQGNVLGELGNMLWDLGGGLGETVVDLGKDAWDLGKNALGNAWETVTDFGADVIEVGEDVVEFIGDGVEVVIDGAVEFAGDVKDTVVDVVELGADGVKKGMKAIDDFFDMPWER